MSKEIKKEYPAPSGYWEFERITAWSFNRLKGKLYNLIESTATNATQEKAMKGLVKGFANDEYKLCVEEMKFNAIALKIISEEDTKFPQSAEPLENKNGLFG